MVDDYIPRPVPRFHACRNNFVTHVIGHAVHDRIRRRGHADAQDCSVGAPYPTNAVIGAEIRGRVAWASRPRDCEPAPTPPPPGWPPQNTQGREPERAELGGCPHVLCPRLLSPFIRRADSTRRATWL